MNGNPQRFGYHRGKETTDIVLDGVVYPAEVKELEHVRLAAVAKRKHGGGASDVKAPMPGMVIAISVQVGDVVKKNQSLLSLHAMKLENDIRAPREGVVKEIAVKPNDVLEKGALMIKLGALPEKQDS
jgi:biotin carboxyl carrier protein